MVTANQLSYIQGDTTDNLNFLGLGKAAREARAERRKIRTQARADTKLERAKRNTDRAIELAKKGIDTSWAGFGKGLVGGFSTLLGSSSGGNIGGLLNTGNFQTDPIFESGTYPANENPAPNNTGLYIGLGVGGFILVGLIVWAIAKK